jgi:predicted alpha/beta superfamily hydrolase
MVNHIKNKKMNSLKPLHFKFTAILLLICCSSLFGQKLAPKERILKPDHTIFSKIRGRDYQLYLSFPKNYSTKDSISYPVLYILDGMYTFPVIKGIRPFFERDTEDFIVVGVNASNFKYRNDDYTTSVATFDDEKNEKRNATKSAFKTGGAAKFLESLKTEIIPFVDKNYKTNADRGIHGGSLGGLFAAYCLVNSDGYFTRFGISSPSFWWDNEELLNQAVAQFTENKTWDLPPTKVYISVGGQERKTQVPTMMKFSKYLENSNYENIDLKWQIFDGESHISVQPANLRKTIYMLYGKNKIYIPTK